MNRKHNSDGSRIRRISGNQSYANRICGVFDMASICCTGKSINCRVAIPWNPELIWQTDPNVSAGNSLPKPAIDGQSELSFLAFETGLVVHVVFGFTFRRWR